MVDRPLRRPDEALLFERALRYLARYAASEAHLTTVLRRKAGREARAHGLAAEELDAMLASVLARLRRAGYLDDQRYAAAKARSLAGKGRSRTLIRATLAHQGVDRETMTEALAALDEDQPELAAAVALARRRRLGPWRPEPDRAASRDRDLAILLRAGFPFATARQVLDAETAEDLSRQLGESEVG